MRDFGVGKKSIEERILEEAEDICREIEKEGVEVSELQYMFNRATTNVICSILFGNRYKHF